MKVNEEKKPLFGKQAKSNTKVIAVVVIMLVLLAAVAVAVLFYLGDLSLKRPVPVPCLDNKGQGDRPYGPAWSTRSPVIAKKGMAATSHPLATQTALDVLKNGGNAVDAAIAANAMIGLVEPTGSGIGGDLMAIVWDPITKQVYGLNAGGRSSKSVLYAQMMGNLKNNSKTFPYFPPYGPYPVVVPGCVDGWFQLQSRFGTKNMSELLNPAIQAARNGFPLTQIIGGLWRDAVIAINQSRDSIPLFQNFLDTYTINGVIPREGQIKTNSDLANTLEAIATGGRDAFYNGTLTDRLAEYFNQVGCCLSKEDFQTHFSTWEEPISTDYRNYTVYELHPNTQGLATLEILNILENFNLTAMGKRSVDLVHVSVEAKKLAFADRAKYYADPAFYNETLIVPALLSKEYAKERSKLINMQRAMESVDAGNPNMYKGDTIYMTVADSSGMMVSLIQSNYQALGSGLVPTGMGFVLQDRGQLFSMDPTAANVYQPGKRPFHTIIPSFVTKNGEPYLSFGVMGGAMQPQGQAQIIINIVDFNMDIQAAGDAARWYHYNDNEPTGEIMVGGGLLGLESGLDLVQTGLSERGHKIVPPPPDSYGGYQAILWDSENQVYHGASEMRKDGYAAGWY